MKKNFGKEIMSKIKKEDIKQTPKFVFVFKHAFVWIFLFLSILIGALSLSMNFEYLYNADWFLFKRIGLLKLIITFLPIFWLIFLLLAIFLSYYNFRNTERGYKYSFINISLINVLLSFIIGIFIYLTGINHFIESKMEKFIPTYRGILVEDKVSRMVKVWQNEESGLILGEILKVNDNNFGFTDYNNKKWIILFGNKTDIKGRVILKSGEKVKIVGEKTGENTFIATQIRPFLGRGK